MSSTLRLVFVAAALLVGGCSPEISRDDLGEVIFTLPKVQPQETPATTQPAFQRESPPG